MTEPIYLDYNATTMIDPAVIEIIKQSLENHWFGFETKKENLSLSEHGLLLENVNLVETHLKHTNLVNQ